MLRKSVEAPDDVCWMGISPPSVECMVRRAL